MRQVKSLLHEGQKRKGARVGGLLFLGGEGSAICKASMQLELGYLISIVHFLRLAKSISGDKICVDEPSVAI